MKLLVLGGTGGVGRHLVAQALERGHDVVAVVRAGSSLEAPGARVVTGDPSDEGALRAAMDGRDAVVSALGMRRKSPMPWSAILGPLDFNSAAARAIVAAMKPAGVPKVVAVSAAGVGDSEARMNALMRFLVATSSIGVAYRDLAVMERVYAESGLDWCCPRPVALTNGPRTGHVRVVERFGLTLTITRADVASWMLDRAEGPISERLPQIAG